MFSGLKSFYDFFRNTNALLFEENRKSSFKQGVAFREIMLVAYIFLFTNKMTYTHYTEKILGVFEINFTFYEN